MEKLLKILSELHPDVDFTTNDVYTIAESFDVKIFE